MPDRDGNTKADEETLPATPLHAYKEGRKDDVSGDADALESTDPAQQQADVLEGDDELELPHDKA
ncbi:MAG: hypothetical protein WAL63_05305 [Solirubrobacteraceae bacterium]